VSIIVAHKNCEQYPKQMRKIGRIGIKRISVYSANYSGSGFLSKFNPFRNNKDNKYSLFHTDKFHFIKNMCLHTDY